MVGVPKPSDPRIFYYTAAIVKQNLTIPDMEEEVRRTLDVYAADGWMVDRVVASETTLLIIFRMDAKSVSPA
jgi:hypothetical protein